MKILLDTQAFLWFVENDTKLPQKVKEIIEDNNNLITAYFLSTIPQIMEIDK